MTTKLHDETGTQQSPKRPEANAAYVAEQFRRAQGAWPLGPALPVDVALHKIMGCPCTRGQP